MKAQNTITPEQMTEAAGKILQALEDDASNWKYDWMKDLCKLCLEYISLDGLQDAKRAAEIPDEILDIAEEALNR